MMSFIFLTANQILVSLWQVFQKQLVHNHMLCWHCCELISHLSSWSIRAAPCAEGQLVPWHVKQLMNFSSEKPWGWTMLTPISVVFFFILFELIPKVKVL